MTARKDEAAAYRAAKRAADRQRLRDEFAMAALTGLLAQTPSKISAAEIARQAYVCADAMLAGRAALEQGGQS